ncbi:unnamed protein product [Paramecium pentaurelia]|uniref:Uncharacterized protein n=1 Tax=Paramecium pentaurelia TaxID=43138 RepID=A0A8S1WAP2_9CILI|nr:unnamed protein product [Paramecium pentaurelia]
MSQTEFIELHESSQVQNKLKPILKHNRNTYLTPQTRTDVAGNQIIKGGNHKISFLPISNEQSPNVVTSSNIRIYSESSESDQEINESNSTLHKKPFLNLKGKNCQNTQTLIVNESRCCIIF